MKRTDTAAPSIAILRRLFGLLRAERGWMLAGIVMAVTSTLAGIGLIAVSGHFITAMAMAGASGAAINYYTPAALIRLLAIVRTLGRYVERLITHDATLRLLARLRTWLFERLAPLAPARMGVLRSTALFSRLRADIDAIEHVYLSVFAPLIVAVVIALGTLVVALCYLPPLGVCLLILLGASGIGLPWWTWRRGHTPSADTVACAETLRELASDGLRGRAELVLYGAESWHAEQVMAATARQRKARREVDTLQAVSAASMMLSAQLATVCVLALGLPALREGTLTAPDLTMLALLAQAVFEVIAPLPDAWAQLGATLASAQRVFALADTSPAIVEPTQPSPQTACYDLTIRQLRLRYHAHGPWALDGVDLDLPQGSRLALMGPSGAGKSSLIGALLRFYPYEGQIKLGDSLLENWRSEDVRSRIAVVEQQPYLFDATLRENLRLGRPDASDEMLHTVIVQARLDRYVARLPHGLNTWIGENGIRISGGEARRIAIARALLVDAPMLILDEPTEGLDALTVNALYDALATAANGRSLLLITHRLGSLSTLVDDVAIMREGRIVERLPVAVYRARMMVADKQASPDTSIIAIN